jgi:hypothetical protein
MKSLIVLATVVIEDKDIKNHFDFITKTHKVSNKDFFCTNHYYAGAEICLFICDSNHYLATG